MRACAIKGEMETTRNGDAIALRVQGHYTQIANVTLSPEQAREWARVLVLAAQKIDGEAMKLSFGIGSVAVMMVTPVQINEGENRLHDALKQMVVWSEEGCPEDAREFVLTESRAALKQMRVI